MQDSLSACCLFFSQRQENSLLLKAKEGNADAVLKILEIYKPLLIKNAIVNGRFDEDLYQELVSTLLQCIQRFQIIE